MNGSRWTGRRRRGLAAAGAVLWIAGIGCKDQGPDPNACQQTYGFGNYGCADLTGTVLSSTEQPLANATVTAGASTDPYEHAELTTDVTGHFKVRLYRRWISPDPNMDTVSTWIHAAVTTGMVPATDSTFTQLRFYRLEHLPVATSVIIHVTLQGGSVPSASGR